ncbi:unnamed protein product [Rodentolepis nana]|uniref:RNase H type-1 domain-containing protein n=1 Tax=Rodentolepis nana TaxID=102285 RepID=A0A3P7TN94_RODNA|nr:unnamed protein product [Rodentolepis nana]
MKKGYEKNRSRQSESQRLQILQWNAGRMSQDKKIKVQKILQTYDVDIFTIMEANISDDKLKYFQFPGYTLYLLPKYRQVASGILTRVKEGLILHYDLIKSMDNELPLNFNQHPENLCTAITIIMIGCAKKFLLRGKTKHYRVFWSRHLEELKRKRDAIRNTADQTGRTEDVQAWRRQSAVLRQAILQAKRTSFDKFISNINYQYTEMLYQNPIFCLALNALSKSNPLQTGLSQGPQEAVTTCTLFNVLINDIAELSAIKSIGSREPPKTAEECRKLHELLREKNKTVVLQWIPGHCGIIGNELADTLAKKGTTILQCMDRPMSFHTMKALIRREFQTSRCNELKTRTKEKQWTVALSDIPDWPRIEAVAEFRLRTGRDCLAKHLHRLGVHTQPTCPLCNLQEETEKTHLIRCPALKATTESQRYWEARRQLMNCY